MHVDNSSEVSSIRSIYGWHFFRQIVWLLIPGGGNSNIFLEFSPRFVGENDPIWRFAYLNQPPTNDGIKLLCLEGWTCHPSLPPIPVPEKSYTKNDPWNGPEVDRLISTVSRSITRMTIWFTSIWWPINGEFLDSGAIWFSSMVITRMTIHVIFLRHVVTLVILSDEDFMYLYGRIEWKDRQFTCQIFYQEIWWHVCLSTPFFSFNDIVSPILYPFLLYFE